MAAATLTVKVTVTEAPPGIEKVPQEGDMAPGAGLTAAVRVAPPASTTEVVAAKLKLGLLGRVSLTITPVARP